MLNDINLLPLSVASKDKNRPELNGLHVTPNYTEASDGYRLIRISRTKKGTDGDYILLKSNEKIAGTFPDVSKVIPELRDEEASVILNCKYLISILDACKKFGAESARITFNGPVKPVVIQPNANAEGQSFLGLLMPIRE